GVHSEASARPEQMRRVANQENAAAPEAVRDDRVPGPCSRVQNLDVYFRSHRLVDASQRIERAGIAVAHEDDQSPKVFAVTGGYIGAEIRVDDIRHDPTASRHDIGQRRRPQKDAEVSAFRKSSFEIDPEGFSGAAGGAIAPRQKAASKREFSIRRRFVDGYFD